MSTQCQCLAFPLRDNTFISFRIQEVLHGEVRKLQTQLTDHTCLSPTGRELNLVVRLRCQVILDIHCSVLRIRYRLRLHIFRIEMSHLGNFTNGTHQVFTAEQHTWLGTKLTTYDIFIQTVVTINDYTVDGSLRAFLDTYFQRDRVVIHIHFYRVGTEEDITIIIIHIGNRIFVCRQTFIQLLLVIHLSRFHSQD